MGKHLRWLKLVDKMNTNCTAVCLNMMWGKKFKKLFSLVNRFLFTSHKDSNTVSSTSFRLAKDSVSQKEETI